MPKAYLLLFTFDDGSSGLYIRRSPALFQTVGKLREHDKSLLRVQNVADVLVSEAESYRVAARQLEVAWKFLTPETQDAYLAAARASTKQQM